MYPIDTNAPQLSKRNKFGQRKLSGKLRSHEAKTWLVWSRVKHCSLWKVLTSDSAPWLKKIIWVIGVLRRTVVSDWRFDNLCGSHLQSQDSLLTLKMASAQVVETSVTNNSPSQDSYHPDDLFQSRYATPGFKPFSYQTVRCANHGWNMIVLSMIETTARGSFYHDQTKHVQNGGREAYDQIVRGHRAAQVLV